MRIYMKDKKLKADQHSYRYMMTSLSGNRLVSKTHGRIVFRGIIDTLEAEVIEAQVLAADLGEGADSAESGICHSLGEILDFLRAVMAAEVKETPLAPPFLFGMDAEELHRRSHDIKGSLGITIPLPSYTQGPLAARLNTLRAKVREAELLAARVFGPGGSSQNADTGEAEEQDQAPREDIILALNRLSSALWWLFCEYVSRPR
jgi:ethanolamine utilization cobalamin adenosyltransferase